METKAAIALLQEIRKCTLCEGYLPLQPKPVCSFSEESKILIVGQAPGIKVHNSGIPWDDASGNRLREWLGVSCEEFYNTRNFAIVPMGFCYPGKGISGDLPPRPECAKKWMHLILSILKQRKFTILIGQYAQRYFLGGKKKDTLTETVRSWRDYSPEYIPLPHPSPRNNIWLRKNPWLTTEVIPDLEKTIQAILRLRIAS